jgi:hypothetical protein
MKKWMIALFFLSTAPVVVRAESSTATTVVGAPDSLDEVEGSTTALHISTLPLVVNLGTLRNNAFKTGEFFKYEIKYEFITAGQATLEVQNGPLVGNRPTYHIISNAQSTKFLDKIFKVRDLNSSIVDQETLVSYQFHQNLKEGHYSVIRNTTFDYDKNQYVYQRTRRGTTTQETGPINEYVSDVLSSFFVTRAIPLKPGKDYILRVFGDKDTYSLLVRVFPKTKTIKVPAGKFECLVIQPFVVGDAIFKASGGKMLILITNDDKKLPVLIRSKVALGAFDCELSEYRFSEPAK